MLQFTRRVLQEPGWGLPASVALHLILALLLLFRLPNLPSPASEQSVNVELVRPPRPEKTPQPEAPKTPELAPPSPQPQAFESATAKQDVKTPPAQERPPTTPEETKKAEKASDAHLETGVEQANGNSSTEKTELTGQIAIEKHEPKTDASKPARPAKRLTRAREIYSKDAISDPRVKQALGKLAPKDRIIQICGIEALEQVRRHKPGAFPDMLAREGGSVSATGLTVSDGAFRSQRKWYAIDFICKANAETMVIDAFSYNIGSAIPEAEWTRRQLPKD